MQNPPGSYPPGSYPPPQGYSPGGFQQPGGYPPGPPSGKTQTLNLDYNVAAGLTYIPICAINLISSILWLVTEPKTNKFVRFHALQSLFLGALGIVLSIAMAVIFGVFFGIAAALESSALIFVVWIFYVLGFGALGLFMLAMIIMGAIKAFGGQIWKMPIVGNFAEKYA